MGPKGMQELGKHLVQKSQYAAKRLSECAGTRIRFTSAFFKEFVVDFSGTGKSVDKINKALLKKKIFGGKNLSARFPYLKNCALYCVTECVTKENIDTLITTLQSMEKK
jgi:glycine dehydrogenase subunit 1